MNKLFCTLVVVGCCVSVSGCACRSGGKDVTATTRPAAGEDGSSAGIRVESARYGRDDVWQDVTPQVRALIKGDTIEFPQNLHKTFNVDPVPGRMKYVDMILIVDGRVMEIRLGDNLQLTPLRLRAAGGRRD